MLSTIVEVDGIAYATRFAGFDRPLEIEHGEFGSITLHPWTYRAHLAALRDSILVADDAVDIDRFRFAGHVLTASGVAEAAHEYLTPLALWWASGGAAEPRVADADNIVALSCGQARLRPWTERERLAALIAASHADAAGECWFDAVSYLDAMVRHSTVFEAPAALDTIDAASTAGLLDAVVALNVPDPDNDLLFRDDAAGRRMARATLLVCGAVGWTPSQVWAAPAAEIDRVLRLVALAQGLVQEPAAPVRRQSLADHPDAVVIRIEDDPA